MKGAFEEIRITDLDVALAQPSQEGTGFLRLYMKLSEELPQEFIDYVDQE